MGISVLLRVFVIVLDAEGFCDSFGWFSLNYLWDTKHLIFKYEQCDHWKMIKYWQIIEWFGSEETLIDHLLQPHCHGIKLGLDLQHMQQIHIDIFWKSVSSLGSCAPVMTLVFK